MKGLCYFVSPFLFVLSEPLHGVSVATNLSFFFLAMLGRNLKHFFVCCFDLFWEILAYRAAGMVSEGHICLIHSACFDLLFLFRQQVSLLAQRLSGASASSEMQNHIVPGSGGQVSNGWQTLAIFSGGHGGEYIV